MFNKSLLFIILLLGTLKIYAHDFSTIDSILCYRIIVTKSLEADSSGSGESARQDP